MDAYPAIGGCIIGLSVAAPIGPIGVLCIQRTLRHGWRSGLASGLGAATADGLYAVVAAFGITVVAGTLVGFLSLLQVLGGILLIGLGIQVWFTRPAGMSVTPGTSGLARDYSTTLFLTLANPMTVLSFAAIFAALGTSPGGDAFSSAITVLGVIAGSTAWWVILTGVIATFRSGMNDRLVTLVNRASGVLIIMFGVIALAFLFL